MSAPARLRSWLRSVLHRSRLESEMGPEIVSSLRAEGQALSLEDAIELARAEG